jgi:hypothetical protein
MAVMNHTAGRLRLAVPGHRRVRRFSLYAADSENLAETFANQGFQILHGRAEPTSLRREKMPELVVSSLWESAPHQTLRYRD